MVMQIELFCDNKGNIIDGDFILAIIAYSLKKKGNEKFIVSTKMSIFHSGNISKI